MKPTSSPLRTLGIIPARGGSKGLPGKNIRQIAGKPLLQWSIEQTRASTLLDRTIVSTDSQQIAEIAKSAGGDVPFLRPSKLARDDSPSSDAVIHALDALEAQGERFDLIVLVEPTSPLRRANDINRTIRSLLENPASDSAVTAGEIHTEHPLVAKRIANGILVPYIAEGPKIHQRQQADKSYFPYGVAYVARVPAYRDQRTFYTSTTLPVLIERWQNFEIDDEVDFFIVEKLLEQFRNAMISI